jgi:uncharacterized RDD family membrane protein YckC
VPYCPNCGAEIPENAKFCPKCGTSVSAPSAPPAPSPPPQKTGIDMIGTDKLLQEHWIKRVIAFIIDSIALVIAYCILAMIIFLPLLISAILTWNFGTLWYGGWLGFPFILGVLSVLYFSFAESMYGQTLGKRIMGLKVTTMDGRMPSLEKTIIRNLSKIYWVLLLLDVFGGLITQGEPRQKFSDRIAGTTVTTSLV